VAPLPTCTFYRNRLTFKGNYLDYAGDLVVTLDDIINPIEEGISNYLYLRTYDGLNGMIVERNFVNLDPF
jgi:hypothetical protein